ncbi:MAG: GNAT family N-acetyltransferase [Pseudomonadota bacterium]|nr:GNAT family N-acetyltransferase [Pseudomonadota bacterium]
MLQISRASTQYEYAACIYIRTMVTIVPQVFDFHEEIDRTENEAVSFIGWLDKAPTATARYRILDGGTGKLERVAIMPKYQGMGFGKAIVSWTLKELFSDGAVSACRVCAQTHAHGFYRKFGFVAVGDPYDVQGVPHQDMILNG